MRLRFALSLIALIAFVDYGGILLGQDPVTQAEMQKRIQDENRANGGPALSPEVVDEGIRRAKLEEMMAFAAAQHEAAESAAMHNAPKEPDKDGKGWTQRDGKKLRAFRDGVTFKIERIGDKDYFENNEGSTGTRTYDDKRKISQFVYILPARGFKYVGQDPYPENKTFKAWHRFIPLKQNVGPAPVQAPQPSFVQVGPYTVPVAAFGLPR